jgi:shikimate kinase
VGEADMNKIILFGHRGVGKSSLGRRLQKHLSLPFFDLDEEIEKKEGRSPREIFSLQGEKTFRDLEIEVFSHLWRRQDKFVVVVGAGFDFDRVADLTGSDEGQWVWVRRSQDRLKRILLDRPRLSPDLAIEEDYWSRFDQRQLKFSQIFDWIYFMPEGLESALEDQGLGSKLGVIERKIFQAFMGIQPIELGSNHVITLTPEFFQRKRWQKIDHAFKGLIFEMRDDLLERAQIDEIFLGARNKKMISLRAERPQFSKSHFEQAHFFDWALETPQSRELEKRHLLDLARANPAVGGQLILSSHGDEPPSTGHIARRTWSATPVWFKWSPKFESFKELSKAWSWWERDPKRRVFAPRSEEGKWVWSRLWLSSRQPISFFQMSDEFVPDQPVLFEILASRDYSQFFGVLGDPVKYSFSPVAHAEFCEHLKANYYRIQLGREEWQAGLNFLKKLGLVGASVTSPLKNCFSKEPTNTLLWMGESWSGANTDSPALRSELEKLDLVTQEKKVAVWGKGAMKKSIEEIFPQARFYSPRQNWDEAQLRELIKDLNLADLWLWAAPPLAKTPLCILRNHGENEIHLLPRRTVIVFDLNYREDSLAKKFSFELKARFIPGHGLFKAQAELQRKFWRSS